MSKKGIRCVRGRQGRQSTCGSSTTRYSSGAVDTIIYYQWIETSLQDVVVVLFSAFGFCVASKVTLPSRLMEATLIFGWFLAGSFCAEGVAPSTPVLACSLLPPIPSVIASCTTPAGASAISFTSAAERTSLTRAMRDCSRIVVGP